MSWEKSTIYIKAYKEDSDCYSISIESLSIIYVFAVCESEHLELKLKLISSPLDVCIKLDTINVKYSVIDVENILPKLSTYCTWPIITVNNNVIAGVSSVARKIIQQSNNTKVEYLLGFRGNCLMACSEVSVWTMFCEIDMPQSLKQLLRDIATNANSIIIPNCLSRFEYHLSQPVKIHNIYKVARNENNKKFSMDIPKDALNLAHKYAEGPAMTISDIILFPYFHIFFKILDIYNLQKKFPLTHNWYKNLLYEFRHQLDLILPSVSNQLDIIVDGSFTKQSLYKSDMSQYKMEKKSFTKQTNIERALQIISSSNISVMNSNSLYGSDIGFCWNNVPLELNPRGGSLPEMRADRKCEQLESMAKSCIKIVGNSVSTIVDFCSGSGHLGLLLAYLLPKCHVILVENKEKSLLRATERIEILDLKNVTVVQSNLDYFSADFQLGVSLHACGTATDLVMQMCVKKNANFVCCPCCYGGIQTCHLLDFPRSRSFLSLKQLTYKDYLSLAHGADQTHDDENAKTKQGYLCMDIIDTDRKLYAEAFDYIIFLGKLQPVTCTNKNNMLVGIKTIQE
ncbi:glutathione S-transferase C-terminal domain-containing protein homolog isoform X1 [Coccinella septempunctata]|uniref:glutathione S-transferase C-terminal domain-containing protein homolog isoform X1 n=1 Tax=Coccinella septempunctata TaxID=41139 RepID=UPI001D07AA73|nr:glutathione S-transferase C-terminal domain-containing protein homolog isoform X1 [Coccinella septempunctata]